MTAAKMVAALRARPVAVRNAVEVMEELQGSPDVLREAEDAPSERTGRTSAVGCFKQHDQRAPHSQNNSAAAPEPFRLDTFDDADLAAFHQTRHALESRAAVSRAAAPIDEQELQRFAFSASFFGQ